MPWGTESIALWAINRHPGAGCITNRLGDCLAFCRSEQVVGLARHSRRDSRSFASVREKNRRF